MRDEELTEGILRAAIKVHRELGPGLLEVIYEKSLAIELARSGIDARSQVRVPARYGGEELGFGFRLDLLVEERVVVEIKTVESLTDTHLAQVLSYLRLTGLRTGLLLNFNVAVLRHGIRRVSL